MLFVCCKKDKLLEQSYPSLVMVPSALCLKSLDTVNHDALRFVKL